MKLKLKNQRIEELEEEIEELETEVNNLKAEMKNRTNTYWTSAFIMALLTLGLVVGNGFLVISGSQRTIDHLNGQIEYLVNFIQSQGFFITTTR